MRGDKVKKIFTITIMALLVSILSIQATYAYDGGLLHGKPLLIGHDDAKGFISADEYTNILTDGDNSTVYTFPGTPGNNAVLYELPREITINSYYVGGTYKIGHHLVFLNSSFNVVYQQTYSNLTYNIKKSITPVKNVRYVMFRNSSSNQVNLSEFDVFSDEILDLDPPGEVTQIVATPISETQIKIEWIDPADLDFKEVKIYKENELVGTVSKGIQNYTVVGLSANQQYNFKLVTVDETGNQSAGIRFVAKTLDRDETPPAEIKNLKSYVYADRIKFTWENPDDVDFYEVRIYRDGKQIATAVTPANQFTDYDLQEHTTYTFVFHSVDTNGNVSPGVSVTETTKGRPRGKISGFVGEAWEQSVELAWNRHSEATKYYIYQNGVKIGETTETKYTVSGLMNGQTYSFSISPVNEWGEGEKTEEIQLTPVEIPIPSTPTDLRASATNTSITLTWSKVQYARSYRIYQISSGESGTAIENLFFYRASASGDQLVGETAGTSYTISGFQPGQEYLFMVSAVNEKGESGKASITARTTTEIKWDISAGEFLLAVIQFIMIFSNILLLVAILIFAPRVIKFFKQLVKEKGVKF